MDDYFSIYFNDTFSVISDGYQFVFKNDSVL